MSILKNVVKISKLWDQILSTLMISFLRLNGAQIGKGCFISISSRVASSKVIIGNDSIIKAKTKIRTKSLIIGSGCIISENCYISGSHSFTMGDMSFVGKRVRINTGRDVTLGKDVGLGEGSTIWTHGYFPPADEGYPIVYLPVNINDGAWVSTNITILPGVNIGKGVIVGAGSVVTKSATDNQLVAGNPAREIKSVDSFKQKVEFSQIMKKILLEFNDDLRVLDESSGLTRMKYQKRDIWLVDGNDWSRFTPKKDDIVLFKNVNEDKSHQLRKSNWLDFDSRLRNRTRNTLVNELASHLRGYGIRFVIAND